MIPEKVKKISYELLEIIEKYYPGITKHEFDSFGFINKNGSSSLKRVEMCVYIELMKAGAFDNEEIDDRNKK